MNENRLPDYLDHMLQAAADARSFVEGLAKNDFLTDSVPSMTKSTEGFRFKAAPASAARPGIPSGAGGIGRCCLRVVDPARWRASG